MLEDENRRLKKLLAESMLEVSALKISWEKLTRSVDRYAAVEKLTADRGFSERRACRLGEINRSAWQYEPLSGKDDAVRERMREIANDRRRFGYRRLDGTIDDLRHRLDRSDEERREAQARVIGLLAGPGPTESKRGFFGRLFGRPDE